MYEKNKKLDVVEESEPVILDQIPKEEEKKEII